MPVQNGYFISIGGGENQVPLLKTVRSMGLHAITVDKNAQAPGFDYSQLKILESTHEYRKVFNALSQTPLTAPVVGVGCRSYGKASYTASYIADKLRLPGSPPSVVRYFLDKQRYLQKLASLGFPIPPIYDWTSKNHLLKLIGTITYPVVLKPIGGSGKLGIEFYSNEIELRSRIEKSYPNSEDYLLQKFIEGSEITVLGLVDRNDFHLVSQSDKWTTDSAPFLEVAHTLPSQYRDYTSEINIILSSITKFFGFSHTPFVAEFKIDSNGRLYLLEAAPEVGGEFLADALIPEYFGYDYFDILYKTLIGKFPTIPEPQPKSPHKKSCILYSPPPAKGGTVSEFYDFPVENGEKVFFEKKLKVTGEKVHPKKGNASRTRVIGIATNQSLPMAEWVAQLTTRKNVGY